MKPKEFMNQKLSDCNIYDLARAIIAKQKENNNSKVTMKGCDDISLSLATVAVPFERICTLETLQKIRKLYEEKPLTFIETMKACDDIKIKPKTKGLTFMEAIKSHKRFRVQDGKDNDAIIFYFRDNLNSSGIFKKYTDGTIQEISTSEVLYLMNKELEIVEEKKTLSDKIVCAPMNKPLLYISDFKAFIKRVKEKIKKIEVTPTSASSIIINIIDDEAGKELI